MPLNDVPRTRPTRQPLEPRPDRSPSQTPVERPETQPLHEGNSTPSKTTKEPVRTALTSAENTEPRRIYPRPRAALHVPPSALQPAPSAASSSPVPLMSPININPSAHAYMPHLSKLLLRHSVFAVPLKVWPRKEWFESDARLIMYVF